VRDLLSPLADPRLRIDGVDHVVLDISSNGASVHGGNTDIWQVGQEHDTSLLLHGEYVQRARMRVVRREQTPRGTRVGLALIGGFFDLDAARRADGLALLDYQLSASPGAGKTVIPAEFRAAVADAVHVVQYYKRCLAPHEGPARTRGDNAVRELAEKTYCGLRPAYAEIRERASAAAVACMSDEGILRASKVYAETVLTPLLLSAPMIHRSYTKPLGYPGDYQVMLYYYENAFEGDTAFAKAFHKLFVEHPLSAGVCTRRDYVVAAIVRELDGVIAGDRAPTFSVTSLGCGPGKEVPGLVEAKREWPGSLKFRLIDQEERTLQVAFDAGQRALAASSSHGTIECLNLSFGQLLKNPSLLSAGGLQDFIYSTGLFDYLSVHVARQLIQALYDCLKPGGTLLIGNARGPNRYFFCPEFVLDWSLIYRTREEMLELARTLPGEAKVDIELERSEAYWFMVIKKPA
jgi:SAM-dependent methyltransferase